MSDHATDILQTISTLQSLDIYHTPVSKKAYEALRASLPQCRIFYDEQSASPNRRVVHAQ